MILQASQPSFGPYQIQLNVCYPNKPKRIPTNLVKGSQQGDTQPQSARLLGLIRSGL